MLRKSVFFDFLNRRPGTDFKNFISNSVEDEHYINWNEFALPHDYGDAEGEYFAIRNSCAVFDVSPIRKIRVSGVDAGAFLDRLLTRPVSNVPVMRAIYTVFCAQDGNLKDDAILYKYADDDYLIMPSDIDHSPYFQSLCDRFELGDVTFTEYTDALAGIAVQGPLSAAVLSNMGFDGIENVKPFEVRDYELADGAMRISRMGFTADLGYECWFELGLANAFTQSIDTARSALAIAIPGYGLSALQACRLEGGFIVAGWDCSTEAEPQPGFERSPYELGLGWLVNLDAADFVGRAALREQKSDGHKFSLRSFEMDVNRLPDDGADIFAGGDNGDAKIGIVNCSSWSWGLEKTIGNASIESEHAKLDEAWIEVDGARHRTKLSRGPLVTLERRNQVPAPM